MTLGARVGSADPPQEREVASLLYKIHVTGTFAGVEDGNLVYHVSGPVAAPLVSPGNGVIKDLPTKTLGTFTTTIRADANAFQNFYSVIPWTCSDCTLSLTDGTEFQSYPDVPMEARALTGWGLVPEQDPNLLTIRMAGCGGIKGTAGRFAGQVGTLCANDIFSLDASAPGTIVGESHCTITLHTPTVDPWVDNP